MKANNLLGRQVVLSFIDRLRYSQTAFIWDEWVWRFTKGVPEDNWAFWRYLEPVFKRKD